MQRYHHWFLIARGGGTSPYATRVKTKRKETLETKRKEMGPFWPLTEYGNKGHFVECRSN